MVIKNTGVLEAGCRILDTGCLMPDNWGGEF